MGKAIFTVLLKFIKGVTDTILQPINLLVVNFVPDLANLIATFNTGVTRFVGPNLAFFAHLLPPITRNVIVMYLTFLITFYSVVIAVHGVLKVINIIKAIKIW